MFYKNESGCKNIESIIIYYIIIMQLLMYMQLKYEILIELCLIKILLNIMKFEGLTISSYKFHQNEQNNFFYFTFFKTYLMWLRVMVNKNEVNLACPALDLLHFSCVRDHLLRKIFRLSSSLHSFPGNIRYLAQVIYNG